MVSHAGSDVINQDDIHVSHHGDDGNDFDMSQGTKRIVCPYYLILIIIKASTCVIIILSTLTIMQTKVSKYCGVVF